MTATNTAQLITCNGECCSAKASQYERVFQAVSNDVINISGAIDVEETFCYEEKQEAEQDAASEDTRFCTNETVNSNGGSGSPPPVGCVGAVLA
jgi:hypothetical protein